MLLAVLTRIIYQALFMLRPLADLTMDTNVFTWAAYVYAKPFPIIISGTGSPPI